jgi:hypothetical protein
MTREILVAPGATHAQRKKVIVDIIIYSSVQKTV